MREANDFPANQLPVQAELPPPDAIGLGMQRITSAEPPPVLPRPTTDLLDIPMERI